MRKNFILSDAQLKNWDDIEYLQDRLTDHFASLNVASWLDVESEAIRVYRLAIIPLGYVIMPDWGNIREWLKEVDLQSVGTHFSPCLKGASTGVWFS